MQPLAWAATEPPCALPPAARVLPWATLGNAGQRLGSDGFLLGKKWAATAE